MARGGRFLLRTAVVAMALLLVPFQWVPAGASSSRLTGVDVSSWQGTIDWVKVAGAGITFTIAKATEGTTYTDPTYATNKSGAAANGIAFTAYHFARPTSSTANAVAQADYFLNNAKLSAGNLIPALDLESTGGLSTSALQSWTWAWVKEVFARLGVKPMIYTSPNFWQTYMGNTSAFADAGYSTLWIAHWTSAAGPSVPANNWGGHGWTFWQWSDCQTVNGISGCVDGDRYNGTDLTPVRITALSVSRTTGGVVASNPTGINCGAACRAYFDPMGNVDLAATPAAGATFLGWGGACSGSSTCTVAMVGNKLVSARFGYTLTETITGAGPGQISVGPTLCTSECQSVYQAGSSVTMKATPGPDALFSSWSGACSGTSLVCVVAMNASKSVTATFADKPPSAKVSTPTTLNGPIHVAFSEPVHQLSSSNVDFRVRGSSSPLRATMVCSDVAGARVDCTSGGAASLTLTPSAALIPGQYYRLTLDSATVTTKVVDDGALPLATAVTTFRASRFQQEDSLAAAYRWQMVSSTGVLGGSYTREDLSGAKAMYKFAGTGITWYTQIGPSQGLAQVAIDGTSKGTFDLYSGRTHYHAPRTFSGLSSGPHVITITATGKKNTASSAAFVSVDGFAVGGVVNATPTLAYQWNPESSSLAYGGHYVMSNLSGEDARFTFRGTGVNWATMVGPDQGFANVYIDGRFVMHLDNYAASRARAIRGISGLADAVHQVRIVVLGQHDSSAHNSFISIDAWSVT